MNSRAGVIRAQIVALARTIPDLPNQFEQAAARDRTIHGEYGRTWASSILPSLVLWGCPCESRNFQKELRDELLGYNTTERSERVCKIRYPLLILA